MAARCYPYIESEGIISVAEPQPPKQPVGAVQQAEEINRMGRRIFLGTPSSPSRNPQPMYFDKDRRFESVIIEISTGSKSLYPAVALLTHNSFSHIFILSKNEQRKPPKEERAMS
jgi:hypothetical protein